MAFKDKYSMKDEEGKIKISSDAYSIGEVIETLIIKLQEVLRRL